MTRRRGHPDHVRVVVNKTLFSRQINVSGEFLLR